MRLTRVVDQPEVGRVRSVDNTRMYGRRDEFHEWVSGRLSRLVPQDTGPMNITAYQHDPGNVLLSDEAK